MSEVIRVRVRRRRSRRRRRLRRLRIALAFVLAISLSAAAGMASYRIRKSFRSFQVSLSGPATQDSIALIAAKVQLRPKVRVAPRPVYQYSVVRGGVQSPEDLRAAMERDPSVADHYAGFRFDRVRLVRLQHAQLMYLSYRKNGKIYWTRGAHLIPAGETVITDGAITGRTRCANRLSVRKQLAVAPDEPPQAALEQLEAPPMLPPENVNFPTLAKSAVLTGPGAGEASPWSGPRAGDPWLLFPPPLPVSFGGGVCHPVVKKASDNDFGKGPDNDGDADDKACRPVSPPPPPATVPEPGTWLLLASGLAAIGLMLLKPRLQH